MKILVEVVGDSHRPLGRQERLGLPQDLDLVGIGDARLSHG